jgi:DNA-binding XRE family transcriptional regulator/mannose-6-phosphate isomerase-like protein (cupin superfamily)
VERVPSTVGERLRQHRLATGMSLRELARRIGVSPSLISQVEHGKAAPSVATLFAIVTTLGVSFDWLFFGEAGADPGAAAPSPGPAGPPVLRAAERPGITLATGVRWERLTAGHEPGVEFLYCTYPVGGESCPPDQLMSHRGNEYGLILSGEGAATVGERDYELAAGDSIAFDSVTPHRIWNRGEGAPMVAVWTVVGREGDPRVG